MLQDRLRAGNSRFTSRTAINLLRTCHLNLYDGLGNEPTAYQMTRPTEAQRKILRTLRLQHLADDQELNEQIRAR